MLVRTALPPRLSCKNTFTWNQPLPSYAMLRGLTGCQGQRFVEGALEVTSQIYDRQDIAQLSLPASFPVLGPGLDECQPRFPLLGSKGKKEGHSGRAVRALRVQPLFSR